MQYVYSFVCFLSIFIIAVVQLLCVIVCRALVNQDVYIILKLLNQLLLFFDVCVRVSCFARLLSLL